MVGEYNAGETAAVALHAALTGRLVLATFTLSNPPFSRLLKLGVDPFILASNPRRGSWPGTSSAW